MRTGDFDKYVNRVLNAFKDGEKRQIYTILDEHVKELDGKKERIIFIEFLVEEKLLTKLDDTNNPLCRITPTGYAITGRGGWIKHLDERELEIEQARQLVSSSIRTNNLQKWLLWLTTGFTLITLVITGADYQLHQQELQLQLQPKSQKEESARDPQQNIKTEDPNQDSSKISNDSLDNNLKVKK